jgi:hypothetical protein
LEKGTFISSLFEILIFVKKIKTMKDKEKEEQLKKLLEELNIFVDFGSGDKFMITPDEIDIDHSRLILKGSQGQLRWVRIDERYDKQRKS